VDRVPVRAQLLGEGEEPGCLSLGVVEEDDLGHGGGVYLRLSSGSWPSDATMQK
jgi:hypothetical protein